MVSTAAASSVQSIAGNDSEIYFVQLHKLPEISAVADTLRNFGLITNSPHVVLSVLSADSFCHFLQRLKDL
jgi:hypothetical protein